MNTFEINNLFQIAPQGRAIKFIIYSDAENERLNYTSNFIFSHVLNCKVSITTNLEEFKTSSDYKINYSNLTIENAFSILPQSFLFEKELNQSFVPDCVVENEVLYLFKNKVPCAIGFDIFSAVFYFISRYQEWQPFKADEHNRFELNNSLQFKHHMHLKPLVNVWIEELKQALLRFYPPINFPQKSFKYISTIDVDNLYAYSNKGFVRTIGGIAKDCATFNFGNLNKRLNVLLKKQNDPFDVYEELGKLSTKHNVPLIYFFLQRTGTSFDRTVNPHSNAFERVLKIATANRNFIGLHPSYFSSTDETKMTEEFKLIREKSQQEITISRQHYLRFNITTTPKQLLKNGVLADFTMGFASAPGYRAATFTPFYFYDFETETATDILIVPFAVMDGAYFVYAQTGAAEAEKQMLQMAEEAKQLNGIFITVFHERSFDNAIYEGFATVYYNLLQKLGTGLQ